MKATVVFTGRKYDLINFVKNGVAAKNATIKLTKNTAIVEWGFVNHFKLSNYICKQSFANNFITIKSVTI